MANVPKKTKAPPPLPPPKPMSEEKIQAEQRNMYEEISGDEGEDEYTALGEAASEPEGGILKYDYADMERGVRPMSYQQDGSGGSGTGTLGSGSGAFQSNESGSDDDEYIEPLNQTVPQKPANQRNQYMNTNTLDGRDLGRTKPKDSKAATIPLSHRTSSFKEKPSAPHKPNNQHNSFGGTGNNSELLNMLNKRKKHVERSNIDDDVFVKEESSKVAPKSAPKAMYQVGVWCIRSVSLCVAVCHHVPCVV